MQDFVLDLPVLEVKRYETVRSLGLASVCLLMTVYVLSLSVRSEILHGMIHSVQKQKQSVFKYVFKPDSARLLFIRLSQVIQAGGERDVDAEMKTTCTIRRLLQSSKL